jgi:predicted nucleotidyltransferase
MIQDLLLDQERQAVEKLRRIVGARYQLIDFCIFGSKARGDASPDSDIDIMLELAENTPEIESAIDDIVFEINLAHDCFISTVIFSKKELDDGPMSESPLYKVIEREGVRV